MKRGVIILCGGRSSRMGRDKATLPFGPELMLQRMVRLLGEAIAPEATVIVAAPNQALPQIPAGLTIVRDAHENRGPLAALATGLRALRGRAETVYATGCDVPLLIPAFAERIFDLLGDADVAVPFDGERDHTLAAVYRTSVLPRIDELLAAERTSMRDLLSVVHTHRIPIDDLRDIDPQLQSLRNLNHEQDYRMALASAGYANK